MEIATVVLVIALVFITQTLMTGPQQNFMGVDRLGKYGRTAALVQRFVAPRFQRLACSRSLKNVPLVMSSQIHITKVNPQRAQTLLRSAIETMALNKTPMNKGVKMTGHEIKNSTVLGEKLRSVHAQNAAARENRALIDAASAPITDVPVQT